MFCFVGELNYFGWADKGKIEGVEEEKQPFILVGVKGDFLERLGRAVPGCSFEEGGHFANSSADSSCRH